MILDRKDLPKPILAWADSILEKKVSKASVEQKGSVHVGMPWHEGCSEYWKLFLLNSAGDVIPSDFSFRRSGLEGDGVITGKEIGGNVELEDNEILCCAMTYPRGLKIYTSSAAMKLIPEECEISPVEKGLLYLARSTKSAYRPIIIGAEPYFDSLISKGLMDKRRAITTKGRNVLESKMKYLQWHNMSCFVSNPKLTVKLEKFQAVCEKGE